jgi:hypothetical protein
MYMLNSGTKKLYLVNIWPSFTCGEGYETIGLYWRFLNVSNSDIGDIICKDIDYYLY